MEVVLTSKSVTPYLSPFSLHKTDYFFIKITVLYKTISIKGTLFGHFEKGRQIKFDIDQS